MNKEGEVELKNISVIILGIFIVIGFIALVFSVNLGGEIISPASQSNNSGLINITCNTTGIYGAINASVYYNISGGQINTSTAFLLGNSSNITAAGGGGIDNVSQINVTINTASFTDSTSYNLSCTVCNVTAGAGADCWNVSSITNVTFDNTAPRVTNLTIDTSGGGTYKNGSKGLILNVSVNESSWTGYRMDRMKGIGYVYFNITNATAQLNFSLASNTTDHKFGSYFNATVNTSGFPDGLYNITVWANETLGEASYTSKINNSERITVTFDNNAPTVSYTCDPSSTTLGQIVQCTCTGTDGLGSGVNYTIAGTTTTYTSQAIYYPETGTAGTFSTTCTVKDRVGYTTIATDSYTISSSSSSSSGGDGGGAETNWVTSYFPTQDEVNAGYVNTLSANRRIKLSLAGEADHYVGVKSVTTTSAVLVVQSIPQEATLSVGQEKKFDVTGDGYYDVLVKLVSIIGSNAQIKVQGIHEFITLEEAPSEEPAQTQPPAPQLAPETETRNLTWLWILVIVILIIIVIVIILNRRKKKKSY